MSKENFYRPELDGLRFFAFLLVFIHHAPLLLNQPFFLVLKQYGWMGVDLFLCLSAFLFAKLLFVEYQSNGDIDIGNFYIRRSLRIWPLYFVFLGSMLILTINGMGWDTNLLQRTAGMAIFTENIFVAISGYSHLFNSPHLWTISYEEQFYAVIPWSLRRIFKMDHEGKLMIITLFFLIFTLTRLVMIYLKIPHPAIWVLPITHFESIFGGLIVGLGLFDDYLKKIPSWLAMIAGLSASFLVCMLPNVDEISWILMLTYPLVGLGMSLVLFSIIKEKQWPVKKLLQNKWLAYLGKISYGLYVYHILAINYSGEIASLLKISPTRLVVYPWFVFGTGLCITISIASASYQWLERPFLRLKERFTLVQTRPT